MTDFVIIAICSVIILSCALAVSGVPDTAALVGGVLLGVILAAVCVAHHKMHRRAASRVPEAPPAAPVEAPPAPVPPAVSAPSAKPPTAVPPEHKPQPKQEPVLLFEDSNGNLRRMTPSQIERWQAAGSPPLPPRSEPSSDTHHPQETPTPEPAPQQKQPAVSAPPPSVPVRQTLVDHDSVSSVERRTAVELLHRGGKNLASTLRSTPVFTMPMTVEQTERLERAQREEICIVPDSVSLQCAILSSGKTYSTSLQSCTCEDFAFRKKPCKHMYQLALSIGLCSPRADAYETLFPWLAELRNLPPEPPEAFAARAVPLASRAHPEITWLSDEEYASLTPLQKEQYAFDRWKHRTRTDWDAGVEYERFVGYLCETQGFRVEFNGAKQKVKDQGRDLIVVNRDTKETQIIQCKRYTQSLVHENTVFQLYGSAALYRLDHPGQDVACCLITTSALSSQARRSAKRLSVQYTEHLPLRDYPMIKCNISPANGRIYHMPYDPQYDAVSINPAIGEKYVSTVREAVESGFRRAKKN